MQHPGQPPRQRDATALPELAMISHARNRFNSDQGFGRAATLGTRGKVNLGPAIGQKESDGQLGPQTVHIGREPWAVGRGIGRAGSGALGTGGDPHCPSG